MKLNFITNPEVVKKGLTVAMSICVGIMSARDALNTQKQKQEFDEMRKTVSELTKKK